MLDQAELDFGIYRIMNQKRNDIDKYLDEDLVKQVQSVISENASGKSKEIEKQIEEATAQAHALGIDPNALPKIKELKDQLVIFGSAEDMENDVYSHLATFFSRYYEGGDFISQRRYKKDVYAIPYEGEEVKLHWANADQYYIKTSEYFRTYSFKTNSGKKVEFTLKDATVEQNNNKAQGNQERQFAIYDEKPYEEIDGVMHVNFTYELMPKTVKQGDLIAKAYEMVKPLVSMDFIEVLTTLCPTEKNSKRTLLEKHLNDYVARNTFDYFIHKDLHGFLSRELDFYIKNEMLFIDDINAKNDTEFLQHLTVIKAVKAIGGKIIEFLSSLENFQKKLWLKKKFVVESNYCITLDHISEEFYEEIAKNDAQREEWVRLFGIDAIKGEVTNRGEDLFEPFSGKIGYSVPLSVEFLKQNRELVVDTQYFAREFKNAVISQISQDNNLNEVIEGLLVESENFQALNLLKESYTDTIKIHYIDPPFNLNSGADYAYSTDYKDSTWITLLENRIALCKKLMRKDALFFVRCDYHGNHFVRYVLENLGLVYQSEILLSRSRNEAGSTKMDVTHEFLYLYTFPGYEVEKYKVNRSIADIKWTGFLMAGERNPPQREFLGKVIYPPKGQHFSLVQPKVDKLLSEFHLRLKCKKCGALYYKSPSTKELENTMKKKTEKFKFYDITANTVYYGVNNIGACHECQCEEYTVPYLGAPEEFINDNWLDVSSYSRNWDFRTENSEEVLERVIRFSQTSDCVIDYFGGSCSTVSAAHKMGRKWLGVEMGVHFNTVALPRMKSVLHGEKSGISSAYNYKKSGCFKYVRLEQYEDTLNNLIVKDESRLWAGDEQFNNSYMLGYMLDTEMKDSLFNLKWFENPFEVSLKVTRNNEMKEQKIDMVDTFNYLIGLNVDSISYPKKGICTVEGVTRRGEKTLVIWRDCTKVDNAALESFFSKSAYSTKGNEFDRIYINGDNNLENLRTSEEHWKVVLTEEEFSKRMFEE